MQVYPSIRQVKEKEGTSYNLWSLSPLLFFPCSLSDVSSSWTEHLVLTRLLASSPGRGVPPRSRRFLLKFMKGTTVNYKNQYLQFTGLWMIVMFEPKSCQVQRLSVCFRAKIHAASSFLPARRYSHVYYDQKLTDVCWHIVHTQSEKPNFPHLIQTWKSVGTDLCQKDHVTSILIHFLIFPPWGLFNIVNHLDTLWSLWRHTGFNFQKLHGENPPYLFAR